MMENKGSPWLQPQRASRPVKGLQNRVGDYSSGAGLARRQPRDGVRHVIAQKGAGVLAGVSEVPCGKPRGMKPVHSAAFDSLLRVN